MKRIFGTLVLAILSMVLLSSTALAAKPQQAGGGNDKGSKEPTTLGIDISYPQCGRRVPTDQAFGIVGVNGGNAASQNPCLADQLAWASKSSGKVAGQDAVQLYVNTANPGQVMDQMTSSWPSANTAPAQNPYGECTGGNDQACSWQYGWDRGQYAVDYFVLQAAAAGISSDVASYMWWLDVETMNSWQNGSEEALAKNAAALEGWVNFFKHAGARVGLYSTAVQWGEIVGDTVSVDSNLNGLPNWRPGGASLATAKQACSAAPLTANGKVVLTQFVSKNLDYDYACV